MSDYPTITRIWISSGRQSLVIEWNDGDTLEIADATFQGLESVDHLPNNRTWIPVELDPPDPLAESAPGPGSQAITPLTWVRSCDGGHPVPLWNETQRTLWNRWHP